MRSANLFGPLKGHCPYKALIGLIQASGLAGGFDFGKGPCFPQSHDCGDRYPMAWEDKNRNHLLKSIRFDKIYKNSQKEYMKV